MGVSDSNGIGRLVSRREISELAGIRRETVTNWASRHPDFPEPQSYGGVELFDLESVLRWLEPRTVPAKRLEDGEPEGTTYADRVRRALRGSETYELPAVRGDTAGAEQNADELYGPLADRVRGTGPLTAYQRLLTSLIFVRCCAPGTWGRVRDLVRAAAEEQRDPARVLAELGSLTEAALRAHGQPPGATAAFAALRTQEPDDLAHVVRLCEGLGREGFALLLDRFEARTKRGSEEFATPRGIMRLMADVVLADADDGLRCHDPYLRGGEALVAAAESGRGARLSGDSPHLDSLRLTGAHLALHGARATLRQGTATPWTDPEERRFDRILTNPPFNRKGRDWGGRTWPFGTPPAKNDNYAWLQHVVASLEPGGRAGVVMPNAAGVSLDDKEYAVRRKMIERGVVESVVWLPSKLFLATQISVTVWFLAAPGTRSGPVLLIDAKRMGESQGKQRTLSSDEWKTIADCHASWRNGQEGFCGLLNGSGTAVSVPVAELREHDYSLDPSDYAETESDVPGTEVPVPSPAAALDGDRNRAADADHAVASIRVRERDPSGGAMPSGWTTVRLGDMCELRPGPSSRRLQGVARSETGVPLVKPKHLRDRRVSAPDPERLAENAVERLSRFALEQGDILFIRTGSPGSASLVGPDQAGWIFDTNLTRLRPRPSAGLDPAYLLGFLSLPRTVRWVEDRAATATVIGSIDTRTLGGLQVPLPPLSEQHRIGSALRALDEQLLAHRDLADAVERLRTALAVGSITGPLTLD